MELNPTHEIPSDNLTGVAMPVQDTLFNLEELTVNTTRSVEDMKRDMKVARQMLKDSYESSEAYQNRQEDMKAIKLALSQTREQLNSDPANADLIQKIKDLSGEIKEKTNAVSDYALEYMRMSQQSEIEKDGITYEIVRTAKLVKRLR